MCPLVRNDRCFLRLNMENFYPAYYNTFRCIAEKCPDSCCKEWSVDVDEDAAKVYRNLSGPLGDKLRQILQDTPDGTIMTIENGRCPMWRQDGLCQIQAELGHDALCKTCREFPRLRHDYGNFVELGLELSCPEAARLILNDTEGAWVQETMPGEGVAEYEPEIMDILRRTRGAVLDFLNTTSLSVPRILAVLLLHAYDVQEELDGGEAATLDTGRYLQDLEKLPRQGDVNGLREFFLGLEILTEQWKHRLQGIGNAPVWDERFPALARYFIGRYWLQAVSDYDIVCRVKFAISACVLIGYLGGNFVETTQLFSKEIENDTDNVEAILDGAYTDRGLTDLNLLGLLG